MQDMKSRYKRRKPCWYFTFCGVSFGSCYSWFENIGALFVLVVAALAVFGMALAVGSFFADLLYSAIDIELTNRAASAARFMAAR